MHYQIEIERAFAQDATQFEFCNAPSGNAVKDFLFENTYVDVMLDSMGTTAIANTMA